MDNPEVHDSPDDDRQLLLNIRQGDERALAELIRRYQARLYQLTLRVCGDGSLAEDATVEAFYKIWKKAHQWNVHSSPGAWIHRIAVRTVLDLRRARQRWRRRMKRAGENNSHHVEPDVIQHLMAAERHQRLSIELERAIDTLKTEDRALVHLFYFEDLGLREIGEVLDVSPDALKMRLSRARKRLRQVLEEFDNE